MQISTYYTRETTYITTYYKISDNKNPRVKAERYLNSVEINEISGTKQ